MDKNIKPKLRFARIAVMIILKNAGWSLTDIQAIMNAPSKDAVYRSINDAPDDLRNFLTNV